MSTTHCARAVVLALAASLLLGCPRPKPALDNAQMSGFLEDYTILRPGREGQAAWVCWNEDADWRSLTKIMFEPVSIWRAGGGSLDAVVERDLMALAAELQNIVEARLAKDYQVVRQAGPGVMEIGLAITQADADDTELDVFTSEIEETDLPADTETLAVATKAFLDIAVLEGERHGRLRAADRPIRSR